MTGQWDEELLREHLNAIDVSRILQIPINTHGFDDFISWHYTKHGRYTVWSGYHLQWNSQFGPSGGQLAAPDGSATNPVWKVIWKLKAQSKVKNFIWRTLHGILPLKCILANRHIGTTGQCPICNQGPEDIMHLLFTCHTAKTLWQELSLSTLIEHAIQVDRAGSAVLEHILTLQENIMPGLDMGLKEVVVITCWYLWWMRR